MGNQCTRDGANDTNPTENSCNISKYANHQDVQQHICYIKTLKTLDHISKLISGKIVPPELKEKREERNKRSEERKKKRKERIEERIEERKKKTKKKNARN